MSEEPTRSPGADDDAPVDGVAAPLHAGASDDDPTTADDAPSTEDEQDFADEESTTDAPSGSKEKKSDLNVTIAVIVGVIALIALVGVAVLTASKPSDGKPKPNPSATSVLDVYPDKELPTDIPPAPGAVKPVQVELSSSCADAVAPMRAIQQGQPSGATMTEEQRTTMNTTLANARDLKACSYDEYVSYTEKELLPWMRMPASASATPEPAKS